MPSKYYINTKSAPPRFQPIGKYAAIEFREDCAGSCKECVKKKCVYNVFAEKYLHTASMKEPEYLYTCSSCFRCVQECTKGIFSRVINPEYRTLGDDYWKPNMIIKSWFQAHTGKVPVSGSGYGGHFSGKGFDSMWTDMSEIVRPTRDGIKGREYINTCFELSRRVKRLKFTQDMTLAEDMPEILEIPLPILFQLPNNLTTNETITLSIVKAAASLKTFLLINPQSYTPELSQYKDNLIPCLNINSWEKYIDLILQSKAAVLSYHAEIKQIISKLRSIAPKLTIIVKAPINTNAESIASDLTAYGADTIYFYADQHGNELNSQTPRFLKDMIRQIHLKLVADCQRQKTNLIFSGGIAMPEHIAKSILCGADGVVIDIPLLLAMECRLCYNCRREARCPVKLDEQIDSEWGSQRIVNLIGAWHSQIIEVMGAMGIREARRLRGEMGRTMLFEKLERENFEPIFKRY